MLGRSPSVWPWALPHLYAVNSAPEPQTELVGASASRDGSCCLSYGYNTNGARFEAIGYWRGEYRVVDSSHFSTLGDAEKEAASAFRFLRVRLLLKSGQKAKERPEVSVTGEWPAEWEFATIGDLGVFCAYLHECASAQGGSTAADRFRDSITLASTPTEQLMVYLDTLELAQTTLLAFLPKPAIQSLLFAESTALHWLQGGA